MDAGLFGEGGGMLGSLGGGRRDAGLFVEERRRECCVGNFSPAMGARNQVGIGKSYRPVSLYSLATQFQTRFLESIPRPIAGLKFSTLGSLGEGGRREF